MNFYLNEPSSIFFSNAFLIIFLNVFIYAYLTSFIFFILFLFDLRFFKRLNDMKLFYTNKFLFVCLVFVLLSLAGMPPMLGFIAKLLSILFFYSKLNLVIFIIFCLVNFFSIYFYILNLKHLVGNEHSIFFNIKGNVIYLNFFIIFMLVLMFTFNVGALFFIQDIIFFCYFF
jgi:NADH:ubiquinone oxidoreductase subunit 2 (subunit N)